MASSGYDSIVVGARCGGAVLAALLARAGQSVLLVDHRPPPRNVVSTHFIFPNTLARLARLGALERLESRHSLHYAPFAWRVNGFEVSGEFTPVDGFTLATSIRRPTLDQALLEIALEAGAEPRFGEKVTGLLGAGREDDPVRGVMLASGQVVYGKRVYGADGRASTVAAKLGLEKSQPMAGEFSLLFAYWRGLPPFEEGGLDAKPDKTLTWGTTDDGFAILVAGVRPQDARGSAADREARYLRELAGFPEIVNPGALSRAERVSKVLVAPETMMRGFFHQPSGPGWALVGDACHFKHPATAQGISDAIEQAHWVAEAVTGHDPGLAGYAAWRDERADEHYEWSYQCGVFPRPEVVDPIFTGITSDPAASQDLLDTFARTKRPRSDLMTPERLARWFS